jgi:transcriptional regulator with XRE-family HTH domain
MMDAVMKMYQRIRDLREDNDLNQTEVAKKLNVSQSTYSRYENGQLDIPSGILIALSKLYNVSVDYLLGLKNEI